MPGLDETKRGLQMVAIAGDEFANKEKIRNNVQIIEGGGK
jgi:hypothetical protein